MYKFTFSCVRRQFPLTTFVASSCARHVVKHLSHVKTTFCFAKTVEVFLVHLSSFPWRPYYTRTNFPFLPVEIIIRLKNVLTGKTAQKVACDEVLKLSSSFVCISCANNPKLTFR